MYDTVRRCQLLGYPWSFCPEFSRSTFMHFNHLTCNHETFCNSQKHGIKGTYYDTPSLFRLVIKLSLYPVYIISSMRQTTVCNKTGMIIHTWHSCFVKLGHLFTLEECLLWTTDTALALHTVLCIIKRLMFVKNLAFLTAAAIFKRERPFPFGNPRASSAQSSAHTQFDPWSIRSLVLSKIWLNVR